MIELLSEALWQSFRILAESAPYVLFGLAAAGCVRAFFPQSAVKRHLGGRGLGSIVKASLLGIPLPLCSCGVLPVAVDLRNQGAGKGPSAAFLVSVPETGVDSMAVTYGLLGPVFTLMRPVAAFFTAIVTGILIDRLPDRPASDRTLPCHPSIGASSAEDLHRAAWPRRLWDGCCYAFGDLLRDVGGWLFVGILISGTIAAFVPEDFTQRLFAHEGRSMVLMLLVGVPLYVCASASTPIAAVLIAKGLSPGAALVFLLAGPATNAATVTVLYRFWGKAATTFYLLSIAACSLVMGWAMNRLFEVFRMPLGLGSGSGPKSGPDPFGWITGGFLVLFWLWSLAAGRRATREKASTVSTHPADLCPSGT